MRHHRVFASGLALGVGVLLAARPSFAQGASVERGMKVYEEQKCALCHSIGGKGNQKGPLDGVAAKLSAAEIRQWLVDPKAMAEKAKATRKPPMKAYAHLPAADLDALVAYLQTLKK